MNIQAFHDELAAGHPYDREFDALRALTRSDLPIGPLANGGAGADSPTTDGWVSWL